MSEVFHVLIYTPQDAVLEKDLVSRINRLYPSLRLNSVAIILCTRLTDSKEVFDSIVMVEPSLHGSILSPFVVRLDSFFGSLPSELMEWMHQFQPNLEFRR